jgi:uncharacterized protein with PIN domain
MPGGKPLGEKDRLELNKLLRDLQEQQKDHERAIEAGLEEVQPVLERCVDCQEQIKKIKAGYFPNKP